MKIKFLLGLLFIGLVTTQLCAQQIDTTKLNNYLDYIAEENGGIGNISIYKNGKEIYNRYFGQSNIENSNFNKNTKYQIGSISKLFTATLIWKLIEQEKLGINDRLIDFFPDIPNADKITIKNLLEHSSGLGDFGMKQNSYYWLLKPVKENEILKEIRRQGVLFQPGENASYSNSGYYLLAKIVEMKYNDIYGHILNKQIIEPLNLKNTASAQDNLTNVFLPYKYSYTKGKWQKIEDYYFKNLIGLGGMISTPKTLNEFIIKLLNYRLLNKQTIQRMKPIIGKETFGRGLMLTPFYQHIAYGHGGDTKGNHTSVTYNPNENLAIAIAINGERYPINSFAIDIMNIIYGIDFGYPEFYNKKLTLRKLKKYTGTYSTSELPQKLTFKVKNRILKLKNPALGIPYIRMVPLKSNEFKVEGISIKIAFQPKQQSLILMQAGKEFKMKMVDK